MKCWIWVTMLVGALGLVGGAAASCSLAVEGALADDGAAVDYLRDVKPLFVKHCHACHAAKKQESGLRLDTAAAALVGGDSGPALVPGKSADSLLVRAIEGADNVSQMPPEGRPRLAASEIKLIKAWIDSGAKAPAGEEPEKLVVDHWSFRRPERAPLPVVSQLAWARTPLDVFILDAIERKKLTPSPPASRETLLRRASLDLTGLPPSLEDLADFQADTSVDAYERALDRLLARPTYGERWGRHWLDQARYADSNGYTRDFGRDIWPYRDWVLRATNHDLSFDQFTIDQFAGDLRPAATLDQQVATGFHRNTLINEEGGTDQEQFRVEAVADRVATTGQVWLGLTLGCARCHNHKYDPISQREFYQLFAVLNTCDEPSIEAPTQLNVERNELEIRTRIRAEIADLDKQVESRRAELEASQQAWEKTVTPEQRARLPGPIQIAYDMAWDKRDAANKKTLEDYYRQTEHARTAFPLLDQIAKLRDREPKIPKTLVMKERAEPRTTHIHKRGDFLNLGVQVEPGVPSVLHPVKFEPSSTPAKNLSRLDFARWLVDADNPLTPRVIVNRSWQNLFGRGLVETEDDFGAQGSMPTHPELLDWLAREWVDRAGWSMKRLHRAIMTSAVYRQSSRHRPELEEVDPRNELLARQNRIRVEAEIVRDVTLAAAGLLTREVGGPSVMPPQPDGVYAFTQDPKPWKTEAGANRYRRGMYTFFWRSLPFPMLTVFDAPGANVSCTRRIRSNTPLQALTLANDVAFVECAQTLALRVLRESDGGVENRARFAFQVALSRSPSPRELARFIDLVNQQLSAFSADEPAARKLLDHPPADLPVAELAAWTAASRVLLNLDEFITRE